MKKILLVLMTIIFAIFLTACNGETDTDSHEDPPAESPAPEPEPDTDVTDAPGGAAAVLFPPMPPMGLGDEGRYKTRAEIIAAIPIVEPRGQIVLGSDIRATSDTLVRELTGGHFLSTMASNINGEFFPNPMVTRDIAVTDNPDGSRTYTFTIYTQNRFSDGSFITAAHYVGGIAMGYGGAGMEIVGYDAWVAGEASTFTGVRLYSDDMFSVTIDAQWLPFVWENEIYKNWAPMPVHVLFDIEIADEGDGIFLRGVPNRTLANFPVGAGPYRLINIDANTGQVTLEANPYFAGTWDGYIPRIQTIIIAHRQAPALVDAIVSGEIDMLSRFSGGQVVNAALERLVGGGTHTFMDYPGRGYGLIRFHTDHGPTRFAAVRQAIKWLIDRDDIAQQFMQGHGITAQGPYSLGMWWYMDAVSRGLYDRIIQYTLDPQRAIEILEQDGWNLNAQGRPFVPGVDDVRYKDISGYGLMRLEIRWAVEAGVVADIINETLAREMQAAGIQLTPVFFDSAWPLVSRTDGSGPQFHMFNLGATFPVVYSPWDMLYTTFNRDEGLLETANRLRFINIEDEAGQTAFVDAFIDLMVALNHEVLEIPLYTDIWYCFVPHRLQNWSMGTNWSFSEAIVRAYVNQ